ncbi:MAG: class I SAM-dependent methyltransferase [Myxococcota bacterium]|nr:class I SAM-dependent methyltransferase [Myxococcota bacterium]
MGTSIQVETPACPVCGGETYEPLIKRGRDLVWRKPGQFQVARCTQCKLVATRPRPTASSIGFYYDNTYSGDTQDGMKSFQTESWIGRLISRYRLSVMNRVRPLTTNDHCLDIGCSYGGFLEYIRQKTGCKTSGIDADHGSIQNALGAEYTDYRVGFIETENYPTEHFSVVTFFESLEHHMNPVTALQKAHSILKPGGICVVEVPNYNGLWRRIFGRFWLPLLLPQHLYHFTPTTLRQVAEAAGFKTIRRQQTMFYPLEGVASLGLALGSLLRSPPPGAPVTWRTPLDLAIFLILVALYPLFEVPSQVILRVLGLSGHQILIAEKTAATTSEPTS